VYSVPTLAALPVRIEGTAFQLDTSKTQPIGVTSNGIGEQFSVMPPLSIYGSTKLAAETMALEYGSTFRFPVWVNRCGVLAGAGQFGTAEQGIFSYWMHAHASGKPLRYIGFDGCGRQVRDAFHPDDLATLIVSQMRGATSSKVIFNVGGGISNARSLAQLTEWCNHEFGARSPVPDLNSRPFDVPWLVMDASAARQQFCWKTTRSIDSIFEEIARHVRDHPDWLDWCGVP